MFMCLNTWCVCDVDLEQKLSSTGLDQANRAISTGQLSALLHLHLQPIDVVVFHGPNGETLFRGGLPA